MSVIINSTGGSGSGFTILQGPLTIFVRTVPVLVALSNGSPCQASWTAHGLQVNDPVVFSSPYDRNVVTLTLGSPGTVNLTAHPYANGDPVAFDTSGALPTGLSSGVTNTSYFVVNAAANTFQVSLTVGGPAINFTVSQSGTQWVWRQNTIPSGVIEGAIYFVLNVIDANTFTFSKTAGGPAINTTTAQVGHVWGQTGNDNNTGLAQTRTGALMTMFQAWTIICTKYNLNTQAVTVQCAHGTYFGGGVSANTSADTDTSPVFLSNPQTAPVQTFWLGGGSVTFNGDTTNPDAVVWRSSGGDVIEPNCAFNGALTFQGLRTEGIPVGGNGFGSDIFQLEGFNTITYDTLVFGYTFGSNLGYGIRALTFAGVTAIRGGGSIGTQILATGFNTGQCFQAQATGELSIGSSHVTGVNNPGFDVICEAIDSGFIKLVIVKWFGLWNDTFATFAGAQGFIFNEWGPITGGSVVGGPGAASAATGVDEEGFYIELNADNNGLFSALSGVPGCMVDARYLQFAPVTGFTQVLTNANGHVIIDPAGNLANGTVQMSANPTDGQIVNIRTTKNITNMTFSPNTGQTIIAAPAALTAGQKVEAIYDANNKFWYFSN